MAAVNAFKSNPKLAALIQNKLNGLVGTSSGYVESLPTPVQRRITGLKGVQKDCAKLEGQLQKEILELEKKYHAKFTPLYQKRAKIISGAAEPTAEEIAAGEEEEDEEEEKPDDVPDTTPPTKGIPEFWLTAMKNMPECMELITDADEAALKNLTDIQMEYIERPGFKLIFAFADNEIFTNKTLEKTYFYKDEDTNAADYVYDHAEGTKIQWKAGKDLTVKVENKKQRNKHTKQTRVVKKTVPVDSFFNFFSPPQPPAEEDEEEVDEELEERLEMDYNLGETIKDKLIPNAIDWFTGEALFNEDLDDDLEEGEFEDEDDEDDDDEEAGDEDDSDEEERCASSKMNGSAAFDTSTTRFKIALLKALSCNSHLSTPVRKMLQRSSVQHELHAPKPSPSCVLFVRYSHSSSALLVVVHNSPPRSPF
ncbi:hypothetical protein MRB53_038027 [Persea americana]|nr:hypothetical protein MRB53_038027 [Persea americana]